MVISLGGFGEVNVFNGFQNKVDDIKRFYCNSEFGNDGALGLSELQKAGARCLAESEKSAIVYGMPKRAVEINPLITSMHLDDIITTIKTFGEV